jgi:hypothetical protein
MIKKALTFCICSLSFFFLEAQTESDSAFTYSFKVRNPKMEIVVEESDTVMYTDFTNRLHITVKGKNKLNVVTLLGGEISRSGDYFKVKVTEGFECVLAIYVQKPNGKVELGLTKKYKIVRLQQPYSLVDGVKGDSVIARHRLIESNQMYAMMTRFNKTGRLKISSFEMVVLADTGEVKYPSIGDKFSPAMRMYIHNLKPGVPLSFKNIICIMPNGEPRKLNDMTLFVDCSKKYAFTTD